MFSRIFGMTSPVTDHQGSDDGQGEYESDMNDYEFLTLFYAIEDNDAATFHPRGELHDCDYPKYNKPSGDNCLGHISPDSPVAELKTAIEEDHGDIESIALNVLIKDHKFMVDYIIRLQSLVIL